jgi:hypothetical protein
MSVLLEVAAKILAVKEGLSVDQEHLPVQPTCLDLCQLLIDIKRKYRLLKVCYVPTTIAAFFSFFAAASH